MDLDPEYTGYAARNDQISRVPLSPSKNRRYIAEVDQLRAIAAILVLFYHGLQLFSVGIEFDPHKDWIYSSNPALTLLLVGHSGVGLFIVLSGFILSLGVIGNSVSYKSFLIARILRIYPMFVVCLMIAISAGPSDLISVLTTALPFNGAAVSGSLHGPFSAMSWAVAVECQCYLIFPFMVLFSNQRGSQFLFQIIAVAISLRLLLTLADSANLRDINYWTIAGRIDQFCLGMIAARFFVSKRLQNLRALWFLPAATTIFVMLWLFNQVGGFPLISGWKIFWPDVEGTSWAFFIVTYLSAGRLLPNMISRGFSKLGEISYSSYLIHFAVIVAVIKGSLALHFTANLHLDAIITTLLVVFPVTTAIALLTYHTIELPFLQMRPKYVRRTATIQGDSCEPVRSHV